MGVLRVSGPAVPAIAQALLGRMPHVDLVIGPDNIPELPALIEGQRAGTPPLARTVFDLDAPRFLAAKPDKSRAPASAFITTMKGCDERCSFCIVPTTRGPERYRAASEIAGDRLAPSSASADMTYSSNSAR